VIVVDDGSTDRTAEVAESSGARVLRLDENRGAGAARNAGLESARAGLVAFTDDDCIPDPHWLEELIGCFEDPSVDGAGGYIFPRARPGLISRYFIRRNPWSPLSAELLRSNHRLFRLLLYLRSVMRTSSDLEGTRWRPSRAAIWPSASAR
jgi:glycosyltransferase involved in cell wall biosynthesis